jgi:O-antigen ligase
MKNLLPKIIIGIYFVVLFLPPLGDMILDIKTLRLFVYSILNTVSIVYILSDESHNSVLSKIIKDKLSLIIIAFISWGLLSLTYAFNKTEVIVRIFSFVNFYMTYLVMAVLLKSVSFKFISYFFSFLLLAQVSVSLNQFDTLTTLRNYDFSMNSKIIGIFANRNITAAIYLIQLPFLIYFIKELKNKFFKVVLFCLGLVVMYIIFLLASRTSYVVITVLLSANILFYLISKRKLKAFFKSFSGYLTLIILIGIAITYLSLGSENNATPINRIQTIEIEETSTNTRLRYYTFGIKDFVSNPIIGYGLGNFKIISIERDKENINSYTVPYVMHNDFLEVAVELGIIGLALFLLIFIYPVYDLFNKLKIKNIKPEHIVLLSSLIVYIADSNLNFPFTRASSLLYLAFILASLQNYLNPKSNKS